MLDVYPAKMWYHNIRQLRQPRRCARAYDGSAKSEAPAERGAAQPAERTATALGSRRCTPPILIFTQTHIHRHTHTYMHVRTHTSARTHTALPFTYLDPPIPTNAYTRTPCTHKPAHTHTHTADTIILLSEYI